MGDRSAKGTCISSFDIDVNPLVITGTGKVIDYLGDGAGVSES